MKKLVSYFIAIGLCNSVQSQILNEKNITGSWINAGVIEYYESTAKQACDIKYFDDEKFIPLYLSFEKKDYVKLTYRIEQKIFNYKVNYLTPDSIFITREKNLYRIFVSNDTLKLKYNKRLILFRKVSNDYSTDVFGEFIKGLIFKRHENYSISFIMGGNLVSDSIINIQNFKRKIKELFKCDYVDFVQLGSLRIQNTCLPTIALYSNKEWDGSRIMGILVKKDEVNFFDSSGINLLTLKPH